VYNCTYGEQNVKVALLFEHKSSVPKSPHLQLLQYFLNIQKQQVKQNSAPIPVIPVIVYHGQQQWHYTPFTEYFPGIDTMLARFIPEFEYLLIDLSQYDEARIEKLFDSVKLRMSIVLLKNIFDTQELKSKIIRIFDKGDLLLQETDGKDFYETLLIYLFNVSKTPLIYPTD